MDIAIAGQVRQVAYTTNTWELPRIHYLVSNQYCHQLEREHQREDTQRQSAAHEVDERLTTGKTLYPPALQLSAESLPPEIPASGIVVQPSLRIGASDDAYEREADTIAKQFYGRQSVLPPISRLPASGHSTTQRKVAGRAPTGLVAQLVSSRSEGQSLSRSLRQEMEGSMGYDFSNVRVHTGTPAVQMSQAIGAHAFTQGNHIYFNHGTYRPEHQAGKQLLAHELTHVVQQGAALSKNVAHPATRAVLGQRKPVDVRQRETPGTLRRHAGGAGTTPAFAPKTGTKTTNLENTYGKFKVKHGLIGRPGGANGWGTYHFEVDMEAKKATGTSKIAFVQTVRRGSAPGNWATKSTDPGMTEERAKRTTKKGWRVDTWSQPFYGTQKTGGNYTPGTADLSYAGMGSIRITKFGKHGGTNAYLLDVPAVVDPSAMEFATTAMDMSAGTQFGSIGWGYEFNSSTSTWNEETPRLLRATDSRIKDRDEAMKKWNKKVATKGSGSGAVPGI